MYGALLWTRHQPPAWTRLQPSPASAHASAQSRPLRPPCARPAPLSTATYRGPTAHKRRSAAGDEGSARIRRHTHMPGAEPRQLAQAAARPAPRPHRASFRSAASRQTRSRMSPRASGTSARAPSGAPHPWLAPCPASAGRTGSATAPPNRKPRPVSPPRMPPPPAPRATSLWRSRRRPLGGPPGGPAKAAKHHANMAGPNAWSLPHRARPPRYCPSISCAPPAARALALGSRRRTARPQPPRLRPPRRELIRSRASAPQSRAFPTAGDPARPRAPRGGRSFCRSLNSTRLLRWASTAPPPRTTAIRSRFKVCGT